MTPAEIRKLGLVLCGASAAVLLAMVGVSLATGATQERHEHYALAAEYARELLAHPGGVRLLMGLDIAFLCLYTGFFATFAYVLRGRPLVAIALAAMIGTAVLDIVEDHHILAMLRMAELGHPLDDAAIAFQQVESSTKFSLSYLALVLFGFALPRTGKLAWTLAAFLVVGTLTNAVLDFAAPPDWHAQLDSGRWIGFLLGFALAGAWLRQQPSEANALASV